MPEGAVPARHTAPLTPDTAAQSVQVTAWQGTLYVHLAAEPHGVRFQRTGSWTQDRNVLEHSPATDAPAAGNTRYSLRGRKQRKHMIHTEAFCPHKAASPMSHSSC